MNLYRSPLGLQPDRASHRDHFFSGVQPSVTQDAFCAVSDLLSKFVADAFLTKAAGKKNDETIGKQTQLLQHVVSLFE